VTVQCVGAGVELAVGEPPIERRVGVVEDLLGFAGPGDGPGGVGDLGHQITDEIEEVIFVDG
jgi:hypothetical protein